MTTKEQLIRAIEQAPDAVVEEVFNFLQVAQIRHHQEQSEPITSSKNSAIVSDEMPETPEAETLLELIDRLTADMTEEEIAQLPKDGAEQHDHYIYGIPKRPK